MQLPTVFVTIAALATVALSSPVATTSGAIISEAELAHWLATTDAELTFIGARPNPLEKRSAQVTTVTYCSKRVGTVCGGTCSVYTGGAICLAAPNTACMAATRDIAACDETECNGDCSLLSTCGILMGNGWCAMPGTQSLVVSPL